MSSPDIIKVNITKYKHVFDYPASCTDVSTCKPYDVTFPPGKYLFKVCGGQGGKGTVDSEKGGCAIGTLQLLKLTNLFLYVGGKGKDSIPSDKTHKSGGYNGGGSTTLGAASGAGASDVRSSYNDLNSRIIVGGGSGGSNDDQKGGEGGGIVGGDGQLKHIPYVSCVEEGKNEKRGEGGTQTSGGHKAAFGMGGGDSYPSYKSGGGGGGGGWYGGGLGIGCAAGGGGGSGFISGHPGCANKTLVFTNTKFLNGQQQGNGQITVLKLPETNELNPDSPLVALKKVFLSSIFTGSGLFF